MMIRLTLCSLISITGHFSKFICQSGPVARNLRNIISLTIFVVDNKIKEKTSREYTLCPFSYYGGLQDGMRR